MIGLLAGVLRLGLDRHAGAGTRIAAGGIGVFFLLIAGAIYWLLAFHPPRSWLDVDGKGLTWRTRRSIQLRWDEIAELSLVRSRSTVESHDTVRGPAVLLTLGRRYLRVTVTPAAAKRADVRERLDGRGRRIHIDLGVRRGIAREVQEALGSRVSRDPDRIDDPH